MLKFNKVSASQDFQNRGIDLAQHQRIFELGADQADDMNPMKRSHPLYLCALLLSVVLSGSEAVAQASAPSPASVDARRLEISEELSESLANDLLELSVVTENRDLEKTAEFFREDLVAAAFPSEPTDTKPEVKWIMSHGWTAKPASASSSGKTGRIKATDFLGGWSAFLDHFSEVEDARFKVKVANFDDSAQAIVGAEVPTAVLGASGHARVAFFVIGRDHENRREWARGVIEADVLYASNKHWQFQSFKLTSFDSLLATADIFSEVSEAAGVAVAVPSFRSAGNDSFTYRGAAAADFNNDGWIDLFVCGVDHNYLYLNDGHGHFHDASKEAGLEFVPPCVGVVAFDYDNDGDADVFLTNVGPQVLLRNRLKEDGHLLFTDVSDEAHVSRDAIGFSAAVGDVNGDGLPDVYVTSYNYYGKVVPNSWFNATNGTANLLFMNQGDGTFKEEGHKWGVSRINGQVWFDENLASCLRFHPSTATERNRRWLGRSVTRATFEYQANEYERTERDNLNHSLQGWCIKTHVNPRHQRCLRFQSNL